MPTLPHASPNNIQYYSAHRGPVFGADGRFHHFARQCDPVHLKNGYWKFSAYDDDRRAFLRGLHNPEEVLKAQDAGDGDYEDIMLCWVPGELDATTKPLLGTSAAHLQTICDKRKLLGKTLSFRGAVPLYPLSTDPRLFQSRALKSEIQIDVLSNGPLSPVSPSERVSPAEKLSASTTPVESLSHSTTPDPQAIYAPVPSLSVPQTQGKQIEPPRSDPIPGASPPDKASVRSSPLVTVKEPAHLEDPLHSIQSPEASLHVEHNHREDTPLGLYADNIEDVRCSPLGDTLDGTGKQGLVDGDHDAYHVHGDNEIDKDSVDSVVVLSLASSTPADLFHAQVAVLPCMDCGLIGTHTSGCWIDLVTMSLRPTEDLTTFELHRLANDVDGFDPGPWTTHFGPQEEMAEDARDQLQGMAETIRNLDATANDPELQGLDDQFTVLLWVLKSIGKVQVLGGQSEQNDANMLGI